MPVDFHVEDRVALVTLNRPEALNAMDAAMYQRLSECWMEVRDNPDIWVAVVTGASQPERPPDRQVFTAGADLKGLTSSQNAPEPFHFWQTQSNPLLNRGLEIWKPVVAAVNGLCFAGGMTLLLATDIRIVSEHASFELSEVKRGILPGNGGTQRIVRQMPYPLAMDMLLRGARLDARQALHFGLVNEIVPHDHVLEAAMQRAAELRRLAPLAQRAIKELAVRAQDLPLGEGLRLEEAMQARLLATEDAREGPRAFAEKRVPCFRGR
jgi:E-phenylitaconyl-CoA hydratase